MVTKQIALQLSCYAHKLHHDYFLQLEKIKFDHTLEKTLRILKRQNDYLHHRAIKNTSLAQLYPFTTLPSDCVNLLGRSKNGFKL
jgi:alanyl-tRNA synthetase